MCTGKCGALASRSTGNFERIINIKAWLLLMTPAKLSPVKGRNCSQRSYGRPVELLAEGDFIKPQSLIAPCGFQFLGLVGVRQHVAQPDVPLARRPLRGIPC